MEKYSRSTAKSFLPFFIITLIPKLLKRNAGLKTFEIVGNHLKSPLSYFFLILFGGFQSLESILPNQTGLSAFIASLSSFLLTIPEKQRTDIALFATVRALDQLFTRNLSKFAKSILFTFIFQMSCWQIMYAWFYYPETLPTSYNQWISRLSRMDSRVLRTLRDIKNGSVSYGEDIPLPKDLKEYASEFGLDPEYRGALPCFIAHGGIDGCATHTLHVFRNGILDSIKIYLPLNILMLLLNYKKGIKTKKVVKAMLATLRSCSFLASFISIIWGTICISRNTFNKNDRKSGQLLATFLCGFTILVEKGERRKQLALYTLPKAIESFLAVRTPNRIKGSTKGLVLPLQALLFSTSMAVLLYRFRNDKNEREKSLINSIFKFFLVD